MSTFASSTEAVLEIETPEGVALSFPIGGAGERLVAYVYDFMMMAIIVVVLLIPIIVGFWGGLLDDGSNSGIVGWGSALSSVAIFFVMNFYFTWFEVRASGVTPGKRKVGLQVINRAGGPLSLNAVLVRNMTRNIEITIPLQVLAAPGAVFPGSETAAALLAIGWICVISCLPLFNRYRLRVGDLLGGTIVVDIKQTALDRDIAQDVIEERATYKFAPSQLSQYGIYELQVLEDYLRTPAYVRPVDAIDIMAKIQAKIGWAESDVVKGRDAERFLRDFYTAQRRSLEQSMLLGKRKERKGD